ncbi:MAG: hypothetical protein Q8O67_23705 [Deltaproteobacteria bacterium]|nr:hypothetical protein [Deltaproteobacteria bacterium]
MKTVPAAVLPSSTTALGDWYATLVILGRRQVVLTCSELTFLPVVVAARDIGSVVPRLRVGVAELLGEIGVDSVAIDAELTAMNPSAIGATASRVVLGVMNDFVHQLHASTDADTELEMSSRLARSPLGPLLMTSPIEATLARLSDRLGFSVQ